MLTHSAPASSLQPRSAHGPVGRPPSGQDFNHNLRHAEGQLLPQHGRQEYDYQDDRQLDLGRHERFVRLQF
jgi:hypothetical protein